MNLPKEFLDGLRRIDLKNDDGETNFFDIGGRGHLENPTSDLLAFFMGAEDKTVPRWLTKALLACFAKREDENAQKAQEILLYSDDTIWSKVRAEREVFTRGDESDGRLDIVIDDGRSFIIGIENKIGASIQNPLETYENLLKQRQPGSSRTIFRAFSI